MCESGELREARGSLAEGAGGRPSTAQIPGAAEQCRREPPRFAQCRRMGNSFSPMPAGTFLTSVSAAPGLQWGRRSADELHPRCLCLLFGFGLRCWVWFFFPLLFPGLSLGQDEAEEKGFSGFANSRISSTVMRAGLFLFFLSALYIPAFRLLFCSGLEEKQCFVQRSCAGAEMMGSSSHSQHRSDPQIQPFMFHLCKSRPGSAKLGCGRV